MGKESTETSDTKPEVRRGFIGTLREAGRTIRRHIRGRKDKKAAKATAKQQALTVEKLSSSKDELLEKIEQCHQRLVEIMSLNAGLREDLTKMHKEIYCLNSMDDHRYEFLQSYLPQAQGSLKDEEASYRAVREKLAVHMSCSSDRLDEVLHPGTPESVQTDPIPTEQLKTLKSFDPEGSNSHITVTKELLRSLKDQVAAKKRAIKESRELREKRHNVLLLKRTQLTQHLHELQRQQDARSLTDMEHELVPMQIECRME